MNAIISFIEESKTWLSIPDINITDWFEIFIIAFMIYHIIIWVKDTRAWMLLKGIVVILVFSLMASILKLRVILWIFSKTINVGIIALAIIFQPELRRALEQLGRKNIVMSIMPFDEQKDKHERFSEKTITELVRATYELAKTKTGALIVCEQDILLNEYVRTGIIMDSVVSSQLLINIFEHNTPLHDGAIILRGDRIVAATCYLPLSDNLELSKELGTRHRAGVGISEVSDSITIMVSEETGAVSIAVGGEIIRNIEAEELRQRLKGSDGKESSNTKKFRIWKGRSKDEKKVDQ